MKFRIAVALTSLFIVSPAFAQSNAQSNAQSKSEDKNADRAQLVSSGEITKIDAKKKTIQVKEVLPPASTGRGGGGNGGTGSGTGTGGVGGGRRRTGGGVGYPGGGRGGAGRYPGGGGRPGSGGSSSTQQAKEYKVYITKDTAMKLAETKIDFSDLHVGDRVTVSGFPKGTKGDIEAATIERKFQ